MSAIPFPMIEAIASSGTDKDAPLATALAILFEPSDVLYAYLVPSVKNRLQNDKIASHGELLSIASQIMSAWSEDLKAEFIAGHPRIGEVKGLSALSAQEQAAKATPPEVLRRLAHLNACYERRYPGLIYITFVNGRSRAQVMEEMEDVLGFTRSLSGEEPSIESVGVVERDSEEWKRELERAVGDVVRIAESRLGGLGLK